MEVNSSAKTADWIGQIEDGKIYTTYDLGTTTGVRTPIGLRERLLSRDEAQEIEDLLNEWTQPPVRRPQPVPLLEKLEENTNV